MNNHHTSNLYIAAVLLTQTVVSAQSSHPRLWITAQGVPRLRALSVDKAPSPLGFIPADAFGAIQRQAESYLNEKDVTYTVNMPGMSSGPAKRWSYTLSDEAPPRHDDYSHYPPWTGMSREIEQRIIHLAFIALVTQERPYFEKARQMALHLCKWSGVWTDPSYGNTGACLDTSHLSNAVALFYDWCYDQLSPDERALIRKALAEKAVDGLRKAIPAYGAVGWPNGFAVLTSALGTCAVALRGEDDRSEQWLSESLKFTKEFCDNQGKDGGCMEGPGYGTYGADTLAKLLCVLETAGIRHSLLDHPFFVTLPKYSISLLCPNDKQQTGFGDCWFSQPFPLCMTLLARRGDREAAWYLHQIGAVQCRNIEEFLTIAMKPEAFTAPKRPEWNPSRAFVDVGYTSLRDGFSTQAAFMAFKCGPPEQIVGHNHYDHNSFQINFNGTWIATDPGYAAYFDPPDNKYG
ncbi:MAG: heparinase II/III family protein, partial [Armatimonadetes bacterium]|nr:heparinase II/III family protein [Armatimonadota bacterium]